MLPDPGNPTLFTGDEYSVNGRRGRPWEEASSSTFSPFSHARKFNTLGPSTPSSMLTPSGKGTRRKAMPPRCLETIY